MDNYYFIRISGTIATGLMEKWKTLHWPENLWCTDAASYIIETQPRSRKLDFDDVSGAYFLLSCGLCLGIIAFVVELLVGCSRLVLTSSPDPQPVQETFWVTMK